MKKYKIAIIGLGSIGTRHLKNIPDVLNSRGSEYTIDLIRSGKGKDLDNETINMINRIYHYNDRIPNDYDVIVISNPTHLHFKTIQDFINMTKHMFIEKPVFDKTDIALDALGLKDESIYYVACPLRYTEVIQFIKNNIDTNSVYCARAICSSYLPEWRGEDYRNSYSAHADQGGGVSIDLIHEWDYLYYLFGYPNQIFNISGKFSNLEIDSNDLSLYIASYAHMVIELHLDYFGRKPIREIQLFMSDDTLIGDFINNEIRFLKSGKTLSFNENRDNFLRKEMDHFFELVEGKAVNENDISTALNTLRIANGEL